MASDGQAEKQLVQTLRGDLNLICNEARKRYPAVRESAERGSMKLKTLSETPGFSMKVLSETDDVVHPLLFAAETKNPRIVQISLTSLQKLMQYKAIPQKSVESIVATLKVLMESQVEELKILQTVLLLVTSMNIVRGRSLSKILELCFKLYASREPSVHNTAGVTIRQIVTALFDRLSVTCMEGEIVDEEEEGEEEGGEGKEGKREKDLSREAGDAYLLFQDLCFLTNGDPPAWLPNTLELELSLGLELLETILREYPHTFMKEKVFNLLLTERICPLIIKLFSPSTKYRHSPPANALSPSDKPTFALSVRLLRILSVLIREFYTSLITQCEIFLSMLVRFLDSDKPLWQRTLAMEVLHSFTNHPLLLRSFCEYYDMQEHSSKIFSDIINAVGGFIQSYFNTVPVATVQLPFGITSSSGGAINSSTGHVTSTPTMSGRRVHMFNVRGTTVQVESLPPNSHNKPAFLEMLEKSEVPVIPEGYPLVVAMTALMDAVKSVSLVISDEVKPKKHVAQFLRRSPSPAGDVKEMMLRSSWSGVLASLALLLDTCSDEYTMQLILQCSHKFIVLCGNMGMTVPRDAFLTALCKACLPPKYALSLITTHRTTRTRGGRGLEHGSPEVKGVSEGESVISGMIRGAGGEGVSAVKKKLSFPSVGGESVSGGAVVTSGGGGEGGKATTPGLTQKGLQSALVTVKNLKCTNELLQIINQHGNTLDTAWLLVLTAVQHVKEVFGLSQFQSQTTHESSALALVSVEKKTEISTIIDTLNNLFKTIDKLTDLSLKHLVTALCQLSMDGVSIAPSREPNLFAMTSLLETGTANLHRTDVIWKPITSHLIKVCSCNDTTLRGYAADYLSSLIRSALSKATQQEVYTQLLSPLLSLQSVLHVDVRQKQLECISNVLHSSGQSLGTSWDVILNVIKAAASLPSETLVRAGFQSLQLVVADFMPYLPPPSLPTTLEVSTRYGLQTVDINISLTSVGLLWTISDYLYQNKDTIRTRLEQLRQQWNDKTSLSTTCQSSLTAFQERVQSSTLPVFDILWMEMFSGLSNLCADNRAAVRKSSAQTLFSTISAHGTLLDTNTWEGVLGEVLFPLLDRVHTATRTASTSSLQSSSLLIHHSRDSAKKQWAETQVITLNGTARLFQSRWNTLVSLPNFLKTWTTLLAAIQLCASSTSVEVSVAATNSFLSVVNTETAVESKTESTQQQQQQLQDKQQGSVEVGVRAQPVSLPPELKHQVWRKAWETWNGIGTDCVCKRLPALEGLHSVLKLPPNMERIDQFFLSIPSQKFLVNLLSIFLHIHCQMKNQFTLEDFKVLLSVLHAALPMPVAKDVSPFLVPSANENVMNSLQELVLKCVGVVFSKENVFDESGNVTDVEIKSLLAKKPHMIDIHRVLPLATEPNMTSFYPVVITELLKFSHLAAEPPRFIQEKQGIAPAVLPFMGVNYIPLGLAAQALAVQLYRSCDQATVSLPDHIPELFMKSLLPALKLKHSITVSSQVWMKSVASLLVVLHTSLPSLLDQGPKSNLKFWQLLATILEKFLFTPIPDGIEMNGEKLREYESLDIKLIDLLKRDLLPSSHQAPPEFLQRLTAVLNRGSIHSATDDITSGPFRENFARVCFEALLQFSFVHSQDSIGNSTSQLALNALLERCEGVLAKFVSDEHLSGACPLPRARMNEVSLVLKSVSVLISSLKDAQREHANKVDRGVWHQVTNLYPALVQCVTCNSIEVRTALKEVLAQFSDLILTKNQ